MTFCETCDTIRIGCGCDGAYDDGCFLCTPERQARPPCTCARQALLIGLHGPKHCGKSTVAQAYSSAFGAERRRFAGKLKAMLRTLGLTEAQVDGDEKELPCALLGGKTPRYAMLTLGDDWGRCMIDEDIWCRTSAAGSEGRLVIFDDVRQVNEATALIEAGGIIIQLQREGVPFTLDHVTERPLPAHLVHFTLPNNTTPEAVAEQIERLRMNRPTP